MSATTTPPMKSINDEPAPQAATTATATPAHTPGSISRSEVQLPNAVYGHAKCLIHVGCGAQRGNAFMMVMLGGKAATSASSKDVEANARRVVACWNACRDMVNPNLDVAAMRLNIAEMRRVIEIMVAAQRPHGQDPSRHPCECELCEAWDGLAAVAKLLPPAKEVAT